MAEENPRGTFLVRNSEHNRNGYSLSVKDWEEARGYHPKHYMIKPLDNGGYYIATNQTFPSLPSLVMAYSSEHLQLWFIEIVTVFCFLFFFRKCSRTVPCFGKTLSKAAAAVVGFISCHAWSVGNQSIRDSAYSETWPRQLWGSLVWEVEE